MQFFTPKKFISEKKLKNFCFSALTRTVDRFERLKKQNSDYGLLEGGANTGLGGATAQNAEGGTLRSSCVSHPRWWLRSACAAECI